MKTKLQNLGIQFMVCGLLVISSLYLVWPDPVISDTAQITPSIGAKAENAPLPTLQSTMAPVQSPSSPALTVTPATTRVSTTAIEAKSPRKILN